MCIDKLRAKRGKGIGLYVKKPNRFIRKTFIFKGAHELTSFGFKTC